MFGRNTGAEKFLFKVIRGARAGTGKRRDPPLIDPILHDAGDMEPVFILQHADYRDRFPGRLIKRRRKVPREFMRGVGIVARIQNNRGGLGNTLETPRDMYLGFYYAPGVVCEAIKTAIYAQCMLELLGKNPVPRYCDDHNDIVTCFDAGTADALIGFCQGIQAASPVDSYAAPEPSPEPGYTDEVVMASGSFTQGSTIELSCDGPLREPYTCYLQGGLNFAASRAGVLLAIQKAYFKD